MNSIQHVKNPYKTLCISHDASDNEIRKAYQKLARKFHPDRYNNNATSTSNDGTIYHEEIMAEINAAYEILKDPDQKREYDRLYQLGAFGSNDSNEETRVRHQRRMYERRDEYYPFQSDIGQTFPSSSTSHRHNQFHGNMPSSSSCGFTMSYTSTKHNARTGVRQVIHKTTRFNKGKKYTHIESTSYFPDGRTEHNVSSHVDENASLLGHIVKSMLGISTEPEPKADCRANNSNSNDHSEDEPKKVAWYHNISEPIKKCVGLK